MNSFVNDEKVLEIVGDGDKYISSVDEHILFLKNSVDIVRELCLKAQSFQPYVSKDVSLTLDNVWNIDENKQILLNVESLETEIDNLRDNLLEFMNLNSDIEGMFEQIQQYRKDIESVFGFSSVGKGSNNDVSPVVSEDKAREAIEEQFVQNRNVTDYFNEEVSRQVYYKIKDLPSNGGH